ncbi:MAG: ATP-binding protein [Hyphomicrobiales bacterium]|nr:ATP-binding protein [Hyphomicrobiales bacterium]
MPQLARDPTLFSTYKHQGEAYDSAVCRARGGSYNARMLELRGLRRLHVGPIDLSIGKGTCVSLMGASGSGKSALLRMIADLDPHEGDALLDGRACSSMPAPEWRRLVTYVAAESGWWEESVAAHFAVDAGLESLLPAVGIAREAATWPVARLSTGERQRLALLRAFRPANRVLLLDEPTSGLDAESIGMIEKLLRDRLAQGTSILMVTHDAEQAARMGSRHLLLRDGQVEERAP